MKPITAALLSLAAGAGTATTASWAQTAPPAPAATPAPAAPPAAPAALPPLPPLPPAPGRLYTPGPFDRIELSGASQVEIVQGERDQAFIAGDADLQRSVSVELSDRQLVIRPNTGWRFWNASRLNIQIQLRQLRQLSVSGACEVHAPGIIETDSLRLSISGAGNARFDQLQARELSFHISGAGGGQLAGKVDNLTLQISGKGRVLAEQLKADRARVNISGIGNATLWVTQELSTHISGVGTVDYYGQPQVQRSVSGLGSINGKGEKR